MTTCWYSDDAPPVSFKALRTFLISAVTQLLDQLSFRREGLLAYRLYNIASRESKSGRHPSNAFVTLSVFALDGGAMKAGLVEEQHWSMLSAGLHVF